MAEPNQILKLQEPMAKGLQKSAAALRNTGKSGFVFDDLKSYEEIFKLCDREELIKKLRALASKKDVTAGAWMQIMTQIDYLGSAERDLRMRYRSRLDSYRTGTSSKAFIVNGMKSLITQLESIKV